MRIGKDINESAHIEVNGLQIIGDDIIGFDIQTSTSDSEALTSNQKFFVALLESLEVSERKEYVHLLVQLRSKTPEEGVDIVKRSTMLEKLGGVENVVSITTNLLSLAANPSVQQFIASFKG
jgi:hypothetical protein